MQCPDGVRDHAGGNDAGFRGYPWGPQENSSLGTALDPKLEAGRPRAAPSPRISGGSVRVLVTADTFSGVWTYSRELVSGLVTHGAQVTLVSFGEIPLPHQTAWMDGLHGLEYHPTAFRLDWMQEGEQDFHAAQDYLCAIIRDTRPDFLHLNQLSFGALPVATPRLVVAHGDVITWWLSIHGHEPAASAWLKWYRETMVEGLKRAEAVVTTSRWMEEMLRLAYGDDFDGHIIPPGRNPIYFNPFVTKEESVLAIGRLWDSGKQVALLTQHAHSLPVCIVGADNPIPAPPVPIRADVRLSTGEHEISVKGAQTESQLRSLYSKSTIFAATSRYEPTGLASIEAAFSRCALVANDTEVYRELWGDAALYFERNNADSLSEVLSQLDEDRELTRLYGTRAYNRARERFTARRMVDDYLRLYRRLRTAKVAVA
jgi:glycogen(starch) synthase